MIKQGKMKLYKERCLEIVMMRKLSAIYLVFLIDYACMDALEENKKISSQTLQLLVSWTFVITTVIV